MAVAAQSLVFVVLPNGAKPKGALRASIHLTPRLSGAPHLASFPDLLDWTDLVSRHGLTFKLVCGSATSSVQVARAALRPDLWREIFRPLTYVAPYPRPDFDKRLVVSYPSGVAMDYVRWAYQVAATGQFKSEERLLEIVLEGLSFRENRESTLDQVLAERRVALWRQQLQFLNGDASPQFPAVPVAGLPQKPAATREMVERFALYHHPPAAQYRRPPPGTAADFEKTLDFHKAVAALASYPALMRALGLVFDVELPAGFCGLSPAVPGGAYGTVSVETATPGWTWHVKPNFSLPKTAYFRGTDRFDAAPASDSGAATAGIYQPSDVVGGYLAMSPDMFQLINIELDGTMLKALTLADNLAAVTDPSIVEQTLPSLRSGGLSLIATERAQEVLRAIADNTAFQQAEDAKGDLSRPLNARDLVRGYRLDVWSSQDDRWHSLHRRDGIYRFGPDGGLTFSTEDEEGFTQLAVAQPAEDPTRSPDPVATGAGAPQPGTDLYINERIARWNGWSLSAPRAGRPLNRAADPTLATDADPSANEPITPFKMVASFNARAASLPRLRFGARYRLRARAVDLAGNSPTLEHQVPGPFALPPGAPAPYFRFESVPAPVVLLRTLPAPGGSLLRMVIRSYNAAPALDRAPISAVEQRHIAPPKAGVLMVEHHGMLDDAAGHLKGDENTYDLVTTRDKGAFPTVGNTPIEPATQATVPYFPDPVARGIALANLPQTPDDTTGEVVGGVLRYRVLPDVEPRPGSVTKISFGDPWPERRSVRLILAEGDAAPQWNGASRALTVSLPKSAETDIPVSCFLSPPDLALMGVWDWMRAWFEAVESVAMQEVGAGSSVVLAATARALLTRLVLEGGHEMITPAVTLTLVHAVQQPLGRPAWLLLPVVNDPAPPVLVAALRNAFSPITAWRSRGSHHAVLLGGLRIHGQSTARIDIHGAWTEVLDDLDDPGPTTKPAADQVELIELKSRLGGMLAADGANERYVGSYIPAVDALWFAAPSDTLPGVESPFQVAAPVHQFGDTKHRRVRYRAVAASRFSEYFEPGLDFTRTSDPLLVNVPSSARPAAPDILYAVPTFGWERQKSTNVKTEIRQGNGLRVYLNRPWYSSGEGEQLGVVLWAESRAQPDDAARAQYKTQFTQWGLDPIWSTGQISAVPTTYQLPLASATGRDLTLEGTDLIVDVAGHAVAYDEVRRLWFCDIQLSAKQTYSPFVRLALARYQPRSIAGTELSLVVLADFAQLAPDRSASLTVDPADPTRGRFFVGGVAPIGPTRALITVTVERRDAAIGGDLGWQVAHPADAKAVEDIPAPDDPQSALWKGSIVFAQAPVPLDFRVVVREYEILPIDPFVGGIVVDGPTYGERLVYASIIPWDFEAP